MCCLIVYGISFHVGSKREHRIGETYFFRNFKLFDIISIVKITEEIDGKYFICSNRKFTFIQNFGLV